LPIARSKVPATSANISNSPVSLERNLTNMTFTHLSLVVRLTGSIAK
jgi:hypothetical protein